MSSAKLAAAQKRLNAAQNRQRRRQAGPPLRLTDADLDALATVGPEMQAQVEAYVRQAAGQVGVDLLRAQADHDG